MKYRKYKVKLAVCSLLLAVAGLSAYSQCPAVNDYFQAGETLEYDLYIKLGFLSTKGGTARLKTVSATYEGTDAYKMTLTSSSKGAARAIFELDDTLSCYTTKDLTPLAYFKDAHEGGDYTKERQKYAYSENGQASVRSVRYKNGKLKFNELLTFDGCAYDLMSVVFYARTLDYGQMKKGKQTSIDFISGRNKLNAQIIYDGTEKIKANDGVKYNCIKLSLKISDDAFEDDKNAMKVYLTDDDNRMIVRMDSKLKVGSTKVILKSYRGTLHPVGTKHQKE
ncbi:MAG: DUF3108 domain-containing protein [Prevotella sp.]|jgi:hypothetical protein|nr:DUF3108 domain-containing protein [Prevotella sp.]